MMRTRILNNNLRRSLSNNVLSHVDHERNMPKMVNISDKISTIRTAHARADIFLPQSVINELVARNSGKANEISSAKGPVFATAIVAGTMAAKKTAELIPFCHHLPLDSCDIRVDLQVDLSKIEINCIVKTASYKTGVEMEALVGATHTALTVYDMLKALSHRIEIQNIKLIEKTGGKSHYTST